MRRPLVAATTPMTRILFGSPNMSDRNSDESNGCRLGDWVDGFVGNAKQRHLGVRFHAKRETQSRAVDVPLDHSRVRSESERFGEQ